jgi:hypothetical protein
MILHALGSAASAPQSSARPALVMTFGFVVDRDVVVIVLPAMA